jgi:hypothetical protein
MIKPGDRTPKTPEERKHRRFDLKYPVHVKFHSGNLVSELDAVSRNVSLQGLLLETTSRIPPRSPVSFILTVQGGITVRPIALEGKGKVVRVEPGASGSGFAIAVACKHPIAQIEHYLPATTD